MTFPQLKSIPVLASVVVIAIVGFCEIAPQIFPRFTLFEKAELNSYDWRLRNFDHPSITSNLAAVFIDDSSLQALNEYHGEVFPWPRIYYGFLLRELTAEGARAVGFDILFKERRSETVKYKSTGLTVSSDDYFASQLKNNGNAILAVLGESDSGIWQPLLPDDLFRTNAWNVGHVTTANDPDSVNRRVPVFRTAPDGKRIWALGILCAALELGLDLDHPELHPGEVVLHGRSGIVRRIPVDRDNCLYIHWSLKWNDPRLLMLPFFGVLKASDARLDGASKVDEIYDEFRAAGKTNLVGSAPFKDHIVIVGSIASGNNVSDTGATPLEAKSFLVSKHWNVANSIITGEFIHRSSTGMNLLLIAVLGIASSLITWRMSAMGASLAIVGVILLYTGASILLFAQWGYWIPLILPILGALLMTHLSLVTYRVVVEQNEKREIKGIFDKMVSPNVVTELLKTRNLALGGARRNVTIYFADVRGFTEMVDLSQAQAENFVRDNNLAAAAADVQFDRQAQATLKALNIYLGTISETVKEFNGTLDKFIGDCVMAYWGAPTPNEQHAVHAVRAAIEAQRRLAQLNIDRAAENLRRQKENGRRAKDNQPIEPLLPLLTLGTGINSGEAIVGLMGSEHIRNYTVFGREVNLASRLEAVSGHGRIIIGKSTFLELQAHDVGLAALCMALPAVQIKGFRLPVEIYEVLWKPNQDAAPLVDTQKSDGQFITQT